MSHTLKISDELYSRLESIARLRGLNSIEQLIEEWEKKESELLSRQAVVHEINNLRERLFIKYGEMPDSVELLREDRENR
jgi:hypothetical protein